MDQGKYITLVSSDGFEFVVLREAALRSKVIKSMLDPRSTFPSSLYPLHLVLTPHRTSIYLVIQLDTNEPQVVSKKLRRASAASKK
ncbi:hypothetical protein [Yaniella sp.]|uniref:hypothetical protein n=1 Tax=Yaniella sp. TaxID=2773929 RepID=UPI0026478761|nr:hypothetical protein [Yaniella sp.]